MFFFFFKGIRNVLGGCGMDVGVGRFLLVIVLRENLGKVLEFEITEF